MIVYSVFRTKLLQGLTLLSGALFSVAILLDLVYVGTEVRQGDVQRIFYIHMGAFGAAFLLFFGALLAGVVYLLTEHEKWDVLALATIEIALMFSLVNIVTGAVWARSSWNTWWTGDPRLTSIIIMWLIYIAYLLLRNAIARPDQQRRFAAIYAIVAFTTVIFTIVIIRLQPNTIHPVNIGSAPNNAAAEGGFNFSDRIRVTLLFNIFSFSVIAMNVAWHRIRLENRLRQIELRKTRLIAHN